MALFNAPVINNVSEVTEIDKCEEEIRRRAAARLLSYVKWTKEELSWRMDDYTCRKFGKAMAMRIKCASTGCFITNWNFGEVRDECQGLLSMLDLEYLEGRLDGWCEDERSLLKTLLHQLPDGFSWHQLVHYIKVLRLTRLQVCNMDQTLTRLLQLKALVLWSNLMTDCDGSTLPKDLRFLELYNNSMTDLKKLALDPPTKLLYLGVGRNQLSTSISLESLINFKHLYYLDVSDNDFLELQDCLNLIKLLPVLNSLSLYGTPCSVVVSYRRMVQKEIPQLILFDGVDMKKCPMDIVEQNIDTKAPKGKKKDPKGKDDHPKDKRKDDKSKSDTKKGDKRKGDNKKKATQTKEEEFDLTGELQVSCFKVFGVKQPKKEKNAKHLYFFELECPLLDDGLKEYELQRMKAALDGTGELDEELMAICGIDSAKRTAAAGSKNDRQEEDKARAAKAAGDKSKDKKSKSPGKGDKRRSQKGGRRTSRGVSGSKGDDREKQRDKTDDCREAKKYLVPLNKTCQDRHKFSNTGLRWTPLGKNCFLFKNQQMGWISSGDLKPDRSRRGDNVEKDGFGSGSKKQDTPDAKQGNCDKKTGREGKDTSDRDKKLKGESKDSDKNKRTSSKDEALGAKGKNKPGSSAGGKIDGSSKKMLKSERMAAKLELENMKNNLKSLIDRDKEIEGSTKFKTKEIEWARILEFKQPILIKTTDLLALRDVFRTVLTLRLIHTKVKITKKDAKKKSTKKGPESQNMIIPDENVLLREKLAVVPVPLEAIKWNEKYLGYTWDISKPCLAEKYPNVKDMKFGKKGKKGERASKTKNSAKAPLPSEPEMLTVHLGIGVKRDTFF